MTSASPVTRLAHRAGPIEVDSVGRMVQTCLRCDRLVYIKTKDNPKPYRLGRRVFLNENCSGTLADVDR